MINILKLIRYQNLIIIGLTQYLFRYCIEIPIMKMEPVYPVMSNLNFALLVISTILIAAAGYAINDYFDIRTDRINRPDKIIVGKHISRRTAMLIHTVFSIIGILIGIYISYKVGSLKLSVIFIVICLLLWLYSIKYKAYFFVGNFLVAFNSAMVILIVWLFDFTALISTNQIIIVHKNLFEFFLWSFVGFAFVLTIIREILKDIEDIDGDRKVGCSTIPVVIGIPKTKIILSFFILFSVLLLSYYAWLSLQSHNYYILLYLILIIIFPLIYMLFILFRAKNKNDFTFLSNVTKFIIVAGVISMWLIYYWFWN